jgi:uncharacterized protein YneF (UPF0154 family)
MLIELVFIIAFILGTFVGYYIEHHNHNNFKENKKVDTIDWI